MSPVMIWCRPYGQRRQSGRGKDFGKDKEESKEQNGMQCVAVCWVMRWLRTTQGPKAQSVVDTLRGQYVKAAQVVKNNIQEDGELPPAVFYGVVAVVLKYVRANGVV